MSNKKYHFRPSCKEQPQLAGIISMKPSPIAAYTGGVTLNTDLSEKPVRRDERCDKTKDWIHALTP